MSITVDGVAIEASPGELIIDAAERAGVFIPASATTRAWSRSACAGCASSRSRDRRGFSLQPACYFKVTEGMEVPTRSDQARKAQEGVIEFLLVNHPLDCPVCDKGGECPLQDQALSHGPGESRFIEEKRHWAKPIEIGPLVALDRERCIQCARCTRFADEIAGDARIDFFDRGRQDRGRALPRPTVQLLLRRQHRADLPGRALTASRTVSRRDRGTSNRSSRRARPVRLAAGSQRNPRQGSSSASSASIRSP